MTDQFWPGPNPPPAPAPPPAPGSTPETSPRPKRRGGNNTGEGTGQGDKYRAVKLVLEEDPTDWIARYRNPERPRTIDDPLDRGGKMVYAAIAEKINKLILEKNAGFRVSHEFVRRWDPTNPESPNYRPPEKPVTQKKRPRKAARKTATKAARPTRPAPPAKFQPPAAGPAA